MVRPRFHQILLLVVLLFPASLLQALTFQNLNEISKAINAPTWQSMALKKRVKIAILDKGFWGHENEIGKSLPSDTKYFVGPVPPPSDLKVNHGTVMAQLVTAIAKEPILYLYNAYGYSNLKYAVDHLIDEQVDIVLYSEVWEFGGNRDGKGFINALISSATQTGILWINAAGNFEQSSFSSKIQTLNEDWVALPDQNNGLKVLCQSQRKTNCPFRAVLSWNDFKNDPQQGTDKDLDFALTDDFLNIVATSGQKQTTEPTDNRPGYTNYPRETIVSELKPGTYFLRIKNRSKNFKTNDELFISIDGEGLSVPQHTQGQSILNPADNPDVVTVGAWDSERSSFDLRLNKPDLLTLSSVKTDEGEFRGSSNAAAFVAGAIVLVKSRFPKTDIHELIRQSSLSGWRDRQMGIPIPWLEFIAINGRCFETLSPDSLPDHLKTIINMGGIFVSTTKGGRIMVPFDPGLLDQRVQRFLGNEMILATPDGIRVAPRNISYLPLGWTEIFQTPQQQGPCQWPSPTPGRIFRLPQP